MLDADSGPGVKRQHTVSGHQKIFGNGRRRLIGAAFFDKIRILFVKGEGQIQFFGPEHGLDCQLFIHERDSVVAEATGTCRSKSQEVCQLLPQQPFRHSRHRINSDFFPGCPFIKILQKPRGIHNGFRIRHAYHSGKTSCGCRKGTGMQIFLVG